MEQQYLIDSNAVIDYLAGLFPQRGMDFMNDVVNAIPVISVITKIELLGYDSSDKDHSLLSGFIHAGIVLNMTDDIVIKTISIRRKHKIKIPDAIIASSALVNDFTLLSHNTNDFKNIAGLKVVDPWKI